MLQEAILLATLVERMVEALAKPIKDRYPEANLWWLFYLALVLGGLVGWFSEINLLADVVANEQLGRVLSSLLIGGGSSFVHDIFGSVTKKK